MVIRDDSRNDRLIDARCSLRSPSGSGRDMSRQELAEAINTYLWDVYRIAVNVDATYVGHLEQGRHRWPGQRRREAFRHVLGVHADAELGFYINRSARKAVPIANQEKDHLDGGMKRRTLLKPAVIAACRATPTKAAGLVAALTSHIDAGSARDVDRHKHIEPLTKRVTAARRAYQHGRYTTALTYLPELITDLQRATSPDEATQQRIWAMMAETYQVASGLLLKTADSSLASVAADRSIAAAHRCSDRLVLASSNRALVHTLMVGGNPSRASHLAVSAAEALDHDGDHKSPTTTSLFGALLLRGAVAAAHDENRHLAHALLDDAAAAAERVGCDSNAYWTAFGPTNVQLHRISVAVRLGDAGTAVDIAKNVNLDRIGLPERRSVFMIDVARAFTQWGKYDKALDAVRTAEQHAPEEVRVRSSVHGIIGDIAHRSPAPIQRQAYAYADSIGIQL